MGDFITVHVNEEQILIPKDRIKCFAHAPAGCRLWLEHRSAEDPLWVSESCSAIREMLYASKVVALSGATMED